LRIEFDSNLQSAICNLQFAMSLLRFEQGIVSGDREKLLQLTRRGDLHEQRPRFVKDDHLAVGCGGNIAVASMARL